MSGAPALPAARIITEDDAETLRTLALWAGDECPFAAGAMAWHGYGSDPEGLEDAWQQWREAYRRLSDLSGPRERAWFEVYDYADIWGAEGTEQENAIQMAASEADDALDRFLHGPRR